jgi:hypothetical protein
LAVFRTSRGNYVAVQPAAYLVAARLVVAVKGIVVGEFIEGHFLEQNITKQIPETMVGRCLSPKEASHAPPVRHVEHNKRDTLREA